MKITAKTIVVGIIGNPVTHSLSPQIHNACFDAMRLPFVYVAFQVKDMEAAIRGIRGLGIRGVSVTIPHKVSAMKYMDKIDSIAQRIGAINTIINEDGVMTGYNTDAHGILVSFQKKRVSLSGKRCVILGSGGAARAASFVLCDSGVSRLDIVGIEEDQMNVLIEDLRRHYRIELHGNIWNDKIIKSLVESADVLINATPVGMLPNVNETPVNQDYLRRGIVVFDVIYNPLKTRLLESALLKGCKIITGGEMFVYQAVEQFRLFTGRQAPLKLIKKVFEGLIKQ